MPAPAPLSVASDTTHPTRVDVVIVGGGIVGASTALELAERGIAVALCEKGQVAAEQSSRNWGWVRLSHRDPREIDLMISAIRIWMDLDCRIGADTGYRQCGIAFLAEDEADERRQHDWLALLRERQIDARMISSEAAAALFPGLSRPVRGALHNQFDGRAEPQRAAPAIAVAARARGAAILTGCAVRAVETQAGRVAGVVTERGRIACDTVVVAGGAWSRLFLGNAGVDLPQLRIINSVLRTEPLDGGPDTSVAGKGFAARRREDGGYSVSSTVTDRFELTPDAFRLFRSYLPALCAHWRELAPRVGSSFLDELRTPRRWQADEVTPFERTRVLDPLPSRRLLEPVWRSLVKAFPVFAGARIAQRWAGAIDVTPDAVPVISPIDAMPGLVVATGFSGHGFGIGPGAGRLVAELVEGRTPSVDPAPFRFGRFTDGSEVRLM